MFKQLLSVVLAALAEEAPAAIRALIAWALRMLEKETVPPTVGGFEASGELTLEGFIAAFQAHINTYIEMLPRGPLRWVLLLLNGRVTRRVLERAFALFTTGQPQAFLSSAANDEAFTIEGWYAEV